MSVSEGVQLTPVSLPDTVSKDMKLIKDRTAWNGKEREQTELMSWFQAERLRKQLLWVIFVVYLLYLCGMEILMTAEIIYSQGINSRENRELWSQSLNVMMMRCNLTKDNQHSPPIDRLWLIFFFFQHFFWYILLLLQQTSIFCQYSCILISILLC